MRTVVGELALANNKRRSQRTVGVGYISEEPRKRNKETGRSKNVFLTNTRKKEKGEK